MDSKSKTPQFPEFKAVTVADREDVEAHTHRYATAAFAMGKHGIEFIEQLPGFKGYMIGAKGVATMTSGFSAYAT